MELLTTLAAFGTALLPAVGRSVVGWLENALRADSDAGEAISSFEIKELATTLLRVGFYTGIVFVGWEGFVGDASALSSGAAAVVLDLLLRAIKQPRAASEPVSARAVARK